MRKFLLLTLVVFTSLFWAQAQNVSNFEDLNLPVDSFWNGSDLSGGFTSKLANYSNTFNSTYSSWGGFAYSSKTDTITAGFANMYSSITGSGHYSATYGVGYYSAFSGPLSISIDPVATNTPLTSIFVTNNTYAYLSMRDGDAYSKKFGGTAGNDSDWFMLTITGYKAGVLTDTINFFLADYRFANNTNDYIVKDWTEIYLMKLGLVDSLSFTLNSSDTGAYGMNTPAYFCIDNMSSMYDVSIAENKSIQNLSIYPNPTTDFINIKGIANTNTQIQIIDMKGAIIHNEIIAQGSINKRINLQRLNSGLFVIRFISENNIQQYRIIKE